LQRDNDALRASIHITTFIAGVGHVESMQPAKNRLYAKMFRKRTRILNLFKTRAPMLDAHWSGDAQILSNLLIIGRETHPLAPHTIVLVPDRDHMYDVTPMPMVRVRSRRSFSSNESDSSVSPPPSGWSAHGQ
jgi:hypothetical protein